MDNFVSINTIPSCTAEKQIHTQVPSQKGRHMNYVSTRFMALETDLQIKYISKSLYKQLYFVKY